MADLVFGERLAVFEDPIAANTTRIVPDTENREG
jgi:hypothetical protein